MHTEVHQWIERMKDLFPDRFYQCRVLDVGSRDVNGTPRKHFTDCQYFGIDLMAGKGVDIVGRVTQLDSPMHYHTIVCTEMLEHDREWGKSLNAMYNLLEPDGLLIITAAGPNRGEHGTYYSEPQDSPGTNDYYRNISMEDLKPFADRFEIHKMEYGRDKQDIYFTGLKGDEH